MTTASLQQFVEKGEEFQGTLSLAVEGLVPPAALDNLKKMDRLGLLNEEVLFALVGQAPIDPLGLYGALKHTGVWAFSPHDFTVIQVLAKKKDVPVALMRVDLLSNDLVFVVLHEGNLVEHERIETDTIVAKLRETGMTESRMMSWLKTHINDAVAKGLSGQV